MKEIEIPKFHETFNPILDILSNVETIHHRDMLKKVVDKFYSRLPGELLEQKTKSGETLILNRIAWGKSYLKKGGYISYPKRGMVQITDKGKAQNEKLLLSDLEEETSILDFYTEEKNKSKSTTNEITSSTPKI